MKFNGGFLVLFGLITLLTSCSNYRKISTRNDKNNDLSVAEYEAKLYGKKQQEKEIATTPSDATTKGVLADTIFTAEGDNIIMPDAVDVSNYTPKFLKDKEKVIVPKEEASFPSSTSKPSEAPSVVAIASVRKKKKLTEDMIAFGKKYLGTKYTYGGKKPSTGFDCSGFTRHIYTHFEIPIGVSSKHQAKNGIKIAARKAKRGDLMIFGQQGKVNHVALVVSNDKKGLFVMHSTSKGVRIDNVLASSYWKQRMLYARRIIQ